MKKQIPETEKERLGRQLIRLGDMMGDGLHLEPDGKWISADYRRTMKALGHDIPSTRKNNSDEIDQKMAQALVNYKCGKCQSEKVKQTRKGAMRVICEDCGAKFQFKRSKRK